jgi:hypothetical protein
MAALRNPGRRRQSDEPSSTSYRRREPDLSVRSAHTRGVTAIQAAVLRDEFELRLRTRDRYAAARKFNSIMSSSGKKNRNFPISAMVILTGSALAMARTRAT